MNAAHTDFLTAPAIAAAVRGTWTSAPRCEAVGIATDTRESMQAKLFVALRGDRFDAHDYLSQAFEQGAMGAIVERVPDGIEAAKFPLLCVNNTRAALADVASAWRGTLAALAVAAVTGSAGKTTTRRLIEAACAQVGETSASVKSFNNDIGVPLTMLSVRAQHRYLVAEVGMNHPGEILPLAKIVAPHVALITLAGRAHLEGMGSIEAVAKEKASIFESLARGATAVFPAGQGPLTNEVRALELARRGIREVRFGASEDAEVQLVSREVLPDGSQTIEIAVRGGVFASIPQSVKVQCVCSLPGEHNARNATAAIATALALGVDLASVLQGIGSVVPSEMRFVREERLGVTFFNDTYNANPDAMLAALRTFAELAASAPRRVVFLGEMRELGAEAAELHREIGRAAARTSLDALIAVGPFAREVADGYRVEGGLGATMEFAEFGSDAVDAARSHATPGTHVLIKGSRGARMERFLAELR